MSHLSIPKETLQNFPKASKLEWIETNGLGGFASQTVLGSHLWRYHGLLFASLAPPTHRTLLLSKIEETIVINGERFEFSTNQYEGAVHPEGYKFLESFSIDPFPVWEFTFGSVTIQKILFMTHGKNEITVLYEITSAPAKTSIQLELKPLTAFRDLHSMTQENTDFQAQVLEKPGCLVIRPYEKLPPMSIFHNAKEFLSEGSWYKNFQYTREAERGNPMNEDLYAIGTIRYELTKKEPVFLTANTDVGGKLDLKTVRSNEKAERKRREKLSKKSDADMVKILKRAADQFIVTRDKKATIIAGYPWFADWGRDSFISLPGLLLSSGRFDEAREVIQNFLDRVKQGIIPNTFPEKDDEPKYNTVDASLWLILAVSAFMKKAKDKKFLAKIFPSLTQIISSYEKGTLNNIKMDPADFLITQGADGLALTWMDAVVDGHAVTPRRGKAVEINALWYSALIAMRDLSKMIGAREEGERFDEFAKNVKEKFTEAFWDKRKNMLFDRIDPNGKRISETRLNQILAVSLSKELLSDEHRRAVVDLVREKLLTPFGLRSLSSEHPDYRKNYHGNLFDRDSAYHQGTVWGWALGPYITALRNAYGDTHATKKEVRSILKNFEPHLHDACLGQASEIFDAEAPFTARGCPAQAWTVAELLRAMT